MRRRGEEPKLSNYGSFMFRSKNKEIKKPEGVLLDDGNLVPLEVVKKQLVEQLEHKLNPLKVLQQRLEKPPIAIYAGTINNELVTFKSKTKVFYLVYKASETGKMANAEIKAKYQILASPADYHILNMIAPNYALNPEFGGDPSEPNKDIYILRYFRKDLGAKIINLQLLDGIPPYTKTFAAPTGTSSSSSSSSRISVTTSGGR